MKYHAVLTAAQGANIPPYNPCKLLDFAFVRLSPGETYSSETPGREILAVVLGGKADFIVAGQCFEQVGGRPNVFNGKPHSIYIPANAAFTIRARTALEVALASAPSDLDIAPYVIPPSLVASGAWGAANFKRYYHQILTLAAQPELPASRLIVGETFTPSGNWSTYPPHKHQVDDLPREAYHEEIYFFKVSPAEGFGICRCYNEEGEEENFTIRDNSIHMLPRGYHSVASAPGYTTYYLWFLAGNQRVQATVEDPQVSWVGKTVSMLKELGH